MRFLARVLGVLLVAAGFVGLVVDGTRSIANGTVAFTPVADVAARLLAERYQALKPALESVHPALWDPVGLAVAGAPAAVIAAVLGLVLLRLGRVPPEPIGYLAGR